MPIESLQNIKLKKVNFEELCQAIEVDNKGQVHKEVKIFVYDNMIRALVMIDRFYYEEEKVSSTQLGKWYNIEDSDIFIEDIEE